MYSGKKAFLVNGRGRYIDDINLPDMLYMSIYRSPYARARLKNIDGGLNSHELRAYYKAAVGEMADLSGGREDLKLYREPVLAIDYVNYVGQPIAAVFGKNKYDSEDKLSEVNVDFEPMQAVSSIDESLKSDPVHNGASSNILASYTLGTKFDEKDIDYDISLEDEFFNERILGNSIETRGCIADYRDGFLTFYASTQSVHSIKNGLASTLGLDRDKIRVIQADTGGAFGSKGGYYPEYLIAAYASMKYKKPVKWIETRSEYLMAAYAGRGVKSWAKIYAKNNGKITGIQVKLYVDAGAYDAGTGSFAPYFIGYQITGPYLIKNVYVEAASVITNKSPMGPYRGAGRPEASFIMERMIDLLADRIGKDPADVRLINASDEPFTSPTGLQVMDASRPFLEKALKTMNYYEISKNEKTGLSFFVLIPSTRPGESARIVSGDGHIKVYLGGDTHGQGHEAWARNIIKEYLNVDESLVTLENGDTKELDEGVGAWGSRSAIVGGSALVNACKKIREQVKSKFGEYAPDKLLNNHFDAQDFFSADFSLNSLNANMITARVLNRRVDVTGWYCYYDLGNVLDMGNVIGQIQGGALEGIGQVLSEGIKYSDDGQLITNSISLAGLLKADDIPDKFHIHIAENPSDVPSHAKGLGESPTIGTPSALARAIELNTGRRVRITPIGPDYL